MKISHKWTCWILIWWAICCSANWKVKAESAAGLHKAFQGSYSVAIRWPAAWKGLCGISLCCSLDTLDDAGNEETTEILGCSSGSQVCIFRAFDYIMQLEMKGGLGFVKNNMSGGWYDTSLLTFPSFWGLGADIVLCQFSSVLNKDFVS